MSFNETTAAKSFKPRGNTAWPKSESEVEGVCKEILEKLCELPECVEAGCITEGGVVTGKVIACFAESGTKYTALIPGQEPIENYAGEWELCVASSSSAFPIEKVCY